MHSSTTIHQHSSHRMPRPARCADHALHRTKALPTWLVAMALVLALSACGKKDEAKVATQVAAKVGSEEISVHQINQVLSRTNTANVTPQGADALRRDVLEKLIDQQLAVEQATEKKLNRAPEVVAQIEAARREVLARAYAQSVSNNLPRPTAEETKKYFVEHPQLFSERRVYNLQELLVPAAGNAGLAGQVQAQIAAGKSMDDIATWLRGQNIKFGGGSATRSAEQIPLEVLARLHALKDGQLIVLDNAQGFTVVRIVASQSAPVPEAAALPRIEQFLANQRAAEALAKEIKQLRTNATITYMGDFAQAASASGAPPPAVTSEAAPPAAPATTPVAPNAAAAPAPVPGNTLDDKTRAAIEKGVAGIK